MSFCLCECRSGWRSRLCDRRFGVKVHPCYKLFLQFCNNSPCFFCVLNHTFKYNQFETGFKTILFTRFQISGFLPVRGNSQCLLYAIAFASNDVKKMTRNQYTWFYILIYFHSFPMIFLVSLFPRCNSPCSWACVLSAGRWVHSKPFRPPEALP